MKLITLCGTVCVMGGASLHAAITNVVAVDNVSPVQVAVTTLGEDSLVFTDRTHEYNVVPAGLLGAEFIQTGNNDKSTVTYQLSFDLTTAGTLFLILDNRLGDNLGGTDPASGTDSPPAIGGGVMDWVISMGFTDTGLDIGIDEGGDGAINQSSSVWALDVQAGSFTFLEQNDGGGRNMYGVAFAPIPEPSTFALLGLGLLGVLRRRR